MATTTKRREILTLAPRRQEIARPIAAPPHIPEDRLRALQQAFMRTIKDPDFITEAGKIGIEIKPKSGSEVEDAVSSVYQAAPDGVDEVRKALNP